MSLLTLVQAHCAVNGLNTPSTVASNNDATISQILGILNSLLDEINDQSSFQAYTYEALFTFTAAEDQGALTTLAVNGFQWMLNGTFYDRTLMRPVYGPVSAVEWQALKAIPNPGPFYKYRIRGNNLLINPAPAAPLSTVAFEYASSYGVLAADGTTYKQYFTADDDTTVLPESIIRMGLTYRWKQQKGLPYQDDEDRFWSKLNNAIARDGTKKILKLDGPSMPEIQPGIFVPAFRS